MAFYQQFLSEFLAPDTDGNRDFVCPAEYLRPVTRDYIGFQIISHELCTVMYNIKI